MQAPDAKSLQDTKFKNRDELLRDKVFDYDYGDLGNKLKPGADLHDKLVKYGLDIAERGFSAIRPCHDAMRKADWRATGFVAPEDQNPRDNDKDKPRLVITPFSFRMEEMFLAACNDVFNQDPIFKWKPFPGQDSLINAAVVEYMVQRHALWFDLWLHSDSMLRDAFRYGFGLGSMKWTTERARRPVDRAITDEVMSMAKAAGMDLPRHLRNRMIRDMEEQVVCEGSELQPWDPYTSFWDSSVGPNQFKHAAYKGTMWTCDSSKLLLYERENPDLWFNGWYAKALAERGSARSRFYRRTSTGREDMHGTVSSDGTVGEFYSEVDVLYLLLKIIPSEWEVGDETYPVNYMLAIAGDSVVVGFGPNDLASGSDGTVIVSPNADGHTFVPVSHLLVTSGIAEHIDTVMRCTSASLLKNINGGWTIFNHNILDWDDFMASDELAKVIRPVVPMLTKEMMEAAILNIPHTDVTPNHMQYVGQMAAMMMEGNGSDDIGGPGQLANSDRPTAFGMRAQIQQTSARFRRLAYKIGAQMMTNIGWQMAYNLVQFGQMSQQVDLAGRFGDRIRRELGIEPSQIASPIDPRDLNINFEMEPYSGAMPQIDDLSGMSELLKTGMAIPEIAMEATKGFPWNSLLKAYARKAGFENLDDYGQAAVNVPMPDQMVEEQAQAGNIVPIGQMTGGVL